MSRFVLKSFTDVKSDILIFGHYMQVYFPTKIFALLKLFFAKLINYLVALKYKLIEKSVEMKGRNFEACNFLARKL